MRRNLTNQEIGWKLTLCGCALMLFGGAIAGWIQLEDSGGSLASTSSARLLIPLVPVGIGALLVLLGAARLVLSTRPAYLLLLGLFLDISAHSIPLTVPRIFSGASIGGWSLPGLLPLYVMQAVGLILISAAFLRLLIGVGQPRGTRSSGR